MEMTFDGIKRISGQYGDSWYLLDTQRFEQNVEKLASAMKAVYPKSKLSYSYKTNYLPRLCRLIEEHGGYAEVVSEMEYRLAIAVGVPPSKIIFNGPYKTETVVEELLVFGGQVNIDAAYELDMLERIASKNAKKILRVALRCNFEIGDGVVSRFGFDTLSSEFEQAIKRLRSIPNVNLCGFHCHFATRQLESFRTRATEMLALVRLWFDATPEYICLGGGLFGKMDESLVRQFEVPVPDFSAYAAAMATVFAEEYAALPYDEQPALFLEPGSSLVADTLQFVTKVINIKNIRGKEIATVTGSVFNIHAQSKHINPPLQVVHGHDAPIGEYSDLDFGGYTCIDSDYLYRHYQGPLSVGDYLVFGNVGSYSFTLKPPFILPNVPIVELREGEVMLVKRQEVQSDIFGSYLFD